MRFLVDNSLSPTLSRQLSALGHDSLHLRDRNLHGSEDDFVLALAEEERRVILTADSDFGTLLALGRKTSPSVILFRGGMPHEPTLQLNLLMEHLGAIEVALNNGCIVVVREGRIRTRHLPITDN